MAAHHLVDRRYGQCRAATLGSPAIGIQEPDDLRVGDLGSAEQPISVLVAAMAWGGIWLRDPRLRALLPLRSANTFADGA